MVSKLSMASGASGARARGLFAIEADQVRRSRLCPQLAQQRDDLTAVIGAMVGELMQALPQRICELRACQALVADDALQILWREACSVFNIVAVDLFQLGAHRSKIGIRGR